MTLNVEPSLLSSLAFFFALSSFHLPLTHLACLVYEQTSHLRCGSAQMCIRSAIFAFSLSFLPFFVHSRFRNSHLAFYFSLNFSSTFPNLSFLKLFAEVTFSVDEFGSSRPFSRCSSRGFSWEVLLVAWCNLHRFSGPRGCENFDTRILMAPILLLSRIKKCQICSWHETATLRATRRCYVTGLCYWIVNRVVFTEFCYWLCYWACCLLILFEHHVCCTSSSEGL